MNDKHNLHQRRMRSPRGASWIALIIVFSFFAILPLGLLGFEMGRFIVIQQELHNVCDACALAGTAGLASAPLNQGYTVMQTTCMQIAANTFMQNTILNQGFTAKNFQYTLNTTPITTAPPSKNAWMNISLQDQNGVAQPTGGLAATTMKISAAYSDTPVFLSNLFPVQPIETAYAQSFGGLPQLDLFLCFDVSGSMDDNTPVYFMERYWNGKGSGPTTPGPNGHVAYLPDPTKAPPGGSPAPRGNSTVSTPNLFSDGTIYETCIPNYTGTGLNILPPQNLSYATYTSNKYVHTWSETTVANGGTASLIGLRANFIDKFATPPMVGFAAEQGLPPGNFDPVNQNSIAGHGINVNAGTTPYTDLVYFQNGMSANGLTFANTAVALEASRGNLESQALFLQSQANNPDPALFSSVTTYGGWYAAYWSIVKSKADPIAAAVAAAQTFFTTMNASSNGHFAMIAFADTAGTSNTSTWINNNTSPAIDNLRVDYYYPNGGTSTYPLPLVSLSLTASNYPNINDYLAGGGTSPYGSAGLGPTGQTNIADALTTAIDQLTNKALYRPTAKRAVVLFTDGVPNQPGGSYGPAKTAAFAQATRAGTAGIPIYTIGLSQNKTIQPQEDLLLGDSNNGTPAGIAAISGNGAIYTQVTSSSQLDQAFQQIARSLVVLQ